MAVGAPPVIAQSPEPPASAIASPASPAAPAASPAAPADCADLEGLLPTSLGEGQELSAEVDVGVDGFDPDDMLDPFLGSLGLDRDDVCSVGIRYGPTTTDHIGLLVRVRGAGPGLAGRLATALAERLREYGNQVTEEPVGLPTGPATQLRIVATGEETLLFVADAWAGSALLTPSTSLLGALLPRAAASSTTPAPGRVKASTPHP
ncbi:MAG: hypothetical protein R3C32_11445 [Chloroflexota bacterium]